MMTAKQWTTHPLFQQNETATDTELEKIIEEIQADVFKRDNSTIKIGDKFDTDAFGKVEVMDIFMSATSNTQVYLVKELEQEVEMTWFATVDELDDYESKDN